MSDSKSDVSHGKESVETRKLERMREYLDLMLKSPDPRQAVIGVAASDMMGLAGRLRIEIDKELTEEVRLIEEFDVFAPMIELYLKTSRQLDRYLQLEERFRAR